MTTETLIREKFTAKQAIQSLITGVEKSQSNCSGYEHFRLDMEDYGSSDGSTCYGCVATVTLQELVGYIFTPDNYSDKYIGTENECYIHFYHKEILNHEFSESYSLPDIGKFEAVIDDFRSGDIDPFYEYFDEPAPKIEYNWCMGDYNIEEELPKIQAFYNKVYS